MDFFSYNIATININTITNPTKLNALQTFLRTMDLDVVFLQEVENNQLTLPGYNVVSNVDHTRRGTAIALKEHVEFSCVEKSLDGRLIALRVNNTTLANIYAPSGSIARAERERFFNNTIAYYLRHCTEYVVMGGDFNCVLRQCDATGSNTSPALQATVRQLQMCDVWVQLRGSELGPTYITHNSASRLDRFYVNPGLRENIREVNTHVCSFTNHKAVTLRICLPSLGREHGKGFWSLRPHLLSEENIEEFQIRWQFWTRQRRNFESWIMWWQFYAKLQIKKFFRWKSRAAFDNFHREYLRLYVQLEQAYDRYYQQPSQLTTINRLKGEMLAHQRRFTEMFVKINETYIAGEPLSSFQLGERRRRKTVITQLHGEQGENISNTEAIQEHVLQFFTDLYSEENAEELDAEHFQCDRIIPEGDETNESCMHDITTTEILAAIKFSASRKSPGPDGIPKEFYLRTFDVIHRELNLVINEALRSNIPREFVDGVIVLVKKKGSDNTVRGYRPISLLNFDYKILSRILKMRLENVMKVHHILSDAQKCANPGRNIFQGTLALKDRIAQMVQCKQRGKLISFDLDHAFDRVRHSYLYRTMHSLGLNPELVNLLARISDLSSSRILVNGHLSTPFRVQRSVRQGDPISMHLFVLFLHPLLRNIEQICGQDIVVAYADDISVIVSCVGKIEAMRDCFSRFERISGAKLNWRKTVSVDVGFIDNNPMPVPWLQTANQVKILGIVFANSIRLMAKLNWDALVSKFAQHVWLQSLRSLTLHQKVTVLNIFLTSKVWYVSSILAPSCIHTSKITATMGSFLWSRIPARIPMYQLARDRDKGGLRLQLPAIKCKALLINRHMEEIEAMPFYKSFILQDPARPVNPPFGLPCLKLICQELPQLPPQIRESLTSNLLHQYFVEKTEIPRVERINPRVDWKLCWRNVNMKALNNYHRSSLFMIINEKTEHRNLMRRIGRADDAGCTHCSAVIETLHHKFCECPRVRTAWRLLQSKISSILHGWRQLSFEALLRPELRGIEKSKKVQILKLFSVYINYINEINGPIDIDDLNFHINNEV